MKINSHINILGSLPDWNLVNVFLNESIRSPEVRESLHTYSSIKTDKSVERFERAISKTLISFGNVKLELLLTEVLNQERISNDSLLLLFWNASFNNNLLKYLNSQIYFPCFYSGRVSIKADEVVACLKDLKETEDELKKWSTSTIEETASKYLTLLKKFNLMEGSHNKSITHPFLNDTMFVIFVYWIAAVESKPNLFDSEWLQYSFNEKASFTDRVTQKKYSKFFEFNYTGDKLKIETLLPYDQIYHAIK